MTQGKRKPTSTARKSTSSAKSSSAKSRSAKSSSARAQQPTEDRPASRRPARSRKSMAVKKISKARDVTVRAVSDTAGEVGSGARRAASATAAFLSANALPLTLLGIGTGWLALAVQRRRSRKMAVVNAAVSGQPIPPETSLIEQGRAQLSALGSRARELGHDAIDGLIEAEERAREFAKEHPIATSAAVVATGVGIAAALPGSPLENRVLGPVRDKLEGGAKAVFEDVKSGVKGAIEAATDVKNELVGARR
jgi:hypothetical protein